MFIAFGCPPDSRGTLDVPCEVWEELFEPGCKAAYFYVKLALPKLRQSERAVVLMEAPAPRCDVDSFRGPVPYTIVSYIRGMYVIGMAEEFNATDMRFNGIWPVGQSKVSSGAIVLLLASSEAVSGEIYAEHASSVAPKPYPVEYSKNVHFVDYTSVWLAEQDG
eukprot:1706447-Prymnesium_polylepis.1